MPTPGDAAAMGRLHKIDGGLGASEQEERLLYAMPRAAQWTDDNLERLDADGFYENTQSPPMQADDLFYAFVSGGNIENDFPPHVMQPPKGGGYGSCELPIYDSLDGFGAEASPSSWLWTGRSAAKNAVCIPGAEINALETGRTSVLMDRRS